MLMRVRKYLAGVGLFGVMMAGSVASTSLAATPTPAAKPAAARPWTQVSVVTPEGGILMGNPKAKVHVIEYASLTCPHCAQFHGESVAQLKKTYVARGVVKYEFRNFILNGPDFAASLLARCAGPARFWPLADAFFGKQPEWIAPFQTLEDGAMKRIENLPPERQLFEVAKLGKLDAFVRTRGIPRTMFDRCLTDKKQIDLISKMRADGVSKFKVAGTPTVIVNGATMPQVPTWEDLDKRIRSALK